MGQMFLHDEGVGETADYLPLGGGLETSPMRKKLHGEETSSGKVRKEETVAEGMNSGAEI